MKVEQAKINAYKQMQPQDKVKKDKETLEVNTKKEALEMPQDQVNITLLKEEAEKAFAHLRTIVEDLLRRQGIEIEKLDTLTSEDIKVDAKAREQAQQMIDEDGPLSPENVSNRIVDFAKSISGGDSGKLSLLRHAIEEGFKAAKDQLGELPDISNETYKLIQEKLDAWENE